MGPLEMKLSAALMAPQVCHIGHQPALLEAAVPKPLVLPVNTARLAVPAAAPYVSDTSISGERYQRVTT